MSKNYLSLELGGKPRGLKFNFGTLEHIEQITGEEPMSFTFDSTNYKSLRQGTGVIVYAGLLTNCAIKNEEPDFTKEDVEAWVKDMDMPEIMSVMKVWAEANKTTIRSSQEGGTEKRS